MSFENFCNNSHFEPILSYIPKIIICLHIMHIYARLRYIAARCSPRYPVPAWDVQIYSCPQRRIAVNMYSLIKETETMDNRPTISANCTFLQAAENTQARNYIQAISKSEALWGMKIRIKIWLYLTVNFHCIDHCLCNCHIKISYGHDFYAQYHDEIPIRICDSLLRDK